MQFRLIPSLLNKAVKKTLEAKVLDSLEKPFSRLSFKLFTAVCLATGLICSSAPPLARDLTTTWSFPSEIDILSVTIQELQQFLTNGTLTSVQLTQKYLVCPGWRAAG